MEETLVHANEGWQIISHLGSASLLLPVLLVTAGGLWQSRQRGAVVMWLGSLALAVTVCLTSKVAYIGWGIGIESINFTGVSGHTLFATSVLPVLFYWLAASRSSRLVLRQYAIALGVVLSALVAISRVVLNAHSVSEVVPGWLLGLLVSIAAIQAMQAPIQLPRYVFMAPLALLFAFDTSAATYIPTHSYEIRLALFLSGRDTPYQRYR